MSQWGRVSEALPTKALSFIKDQSPVQRVLIDMFSREREREREKKKRLGLLT